MGIPPPAKNLKKKLCGFILAKKKINYILPEALPPLFSKLHIRLMNPIVQIGKIKIVPKKNNPKPSLPMFYNYYIVNVIIIILCQLTRFFVHRVCESHHKKNRKIYRLEELEKKKKYFLGGKKKKKKKKKK